MSTQFQWVFDNAETINFNRRAVVASTTTRSGIVRTATRGGQIWRFEVKLPDGISWTTARPYIEAIDAADKFTTGLVQINNSGYNTWLTKSLTGISSTTGSWTLGSKVVTTVATLSAGDIIQLGSGKVYSVVSSVGTTTTVNRPVLDSTGSGTITIGPGVTWQVYCVDLPQWTIFSRDQVSWSGPFIFYEVV